MTEQLKNIKNALLHLEWGEDILKGLNDGTICRTELHFIDRGTLKEKLTCPIEDEFGRTHLVLRNEQVKKIVKSACHRLRAGINENIIEYAEYIKSKRNDKKNINAET